MFLPLCFGLCCCLLYAAFGVIKNNNKALMLAAYQLEQRGTVSRSQIKWKSV